MKKIFLAGSVLLFLVCLCKGVPAGSVFGGGKHGNSRHAGGDVYRSMAKDICEFSGLPDGYKIAVIPFSFGDKKSSDAGAMISERLSAGIVKLHKFNVVERQKVKKAIDEIHPEDTGFIETGAMKELGEALNVKAIVTGTLSNMPGDKIYVDVCLTKTDTADIIATTAAELPAVLDEPEKKQSHSPESNEDKSMPIGIR